MKDMMKKVFVMSSVIGMAAILSGCAGMCGNKKAKHHPAHNKPAETVMFYQTYEDAAVNRVAAKMFTRSSRGGESAMGYIKFMETDAGLKMETDLQDLRPGVTYTMRIHQCGPCANGMCCDNAAMPITLPTLRIDRVGQLQETFMIRGLTAKQLNNAKLYLTRDGGYKAAWGNIGNISKM